MKLLEYISLELVITAPVQSKIWLFLSCRIEIPFLFLKTWYDVVFKGIDFGASCKVLILALPILRV